jgi:hypothetical protein
MTIQDAIAKAPALCPLCWRSPAGRKRNSYACQACCLEFIEDQAGRGSRQARFGESEHDRDYIISLFNFVSSDRIIV